MAATVLAGGEGSGGGGVAHACGAGGMVDSLDWCFFYLWSIGFGRQAIESEVRYPPKRFLTSRWQVLRNFPLELNPSLVMELVEQNQFGHRTTEIQIYAH
jgi:hypothetical protein